MYQRPEVKSAEVVAPILPNAGSNAMATSIQINNGPPWWCRFTTPRSIADGGRMEEVRKEGRTDGRKEGRKKGRKEGRKEV